MNILSRMLAEALDYKPLLEMAIDKDKFIDRMKAQVPQIFENWCLVKWADNKNPDVNHWRVEFIAAITKVSTIAIKNMSRKKNYECKHKAIVTYFDEEDYFTRAETIFAVVMKKLQFDEHIPHTEVIKLCKACSLALPKIIELMSDYDYQKTYDYINSI